jgi:PBP1b-binding outer membrane lipoprotein LpoB
MVVYMRPVAYLIVSAFVLSGCSKSPSAVVVTATSNFAQHLMQPLVQKDASAQARRMAELLSNKPACKVFKDRMIAAGKGSPYEGTTEWKIAHTQQDACAAGCCK